MEERERTDELFRILGVYSLKSILGRGSFGKLYCAENTSSKRHSAVRLIRSDLIRDAGFQHRFADHMAELTQLTHNNLTSVQDYGHSLENHWIALDLAPGDSQGAVTLQDLANASGGVLEASLLISLLGGVLRGLSELHEKGLVHGNLKPDNILLYRLPDNRLVTKLTDYGLVSLIGSDAWLSRIRKAVKESMKNRVPTDSRGDAYRALLASREYMAPEYRKNGVPTHHSDIYAMGLIFYRLISGTRLSPRPPSHYNSALTEAHDRYILKALEPKPCDRYPSAETMLDALEPVREMINYEVEQKRREAVSEQVRVVLHKASDLVDSGQLEEAREMLWDLMERYPGRQDVLDDYSAVEERLTELRRMAEREEQYHWDIAEARELEADGSVTEALKVWVLLSRLYSDKPAVQAEIQRLCEATGRTIEDDDHLLVSEQSEVVLRQRVTAYRRRRNEAWDMVDEGRFNEAFAILEELKASVTDREELLTEIEMIEEETLEAMEKTRVTRCRRRNKQMLLAGGIVLVGFLVVAIVWIFKVLS